MFRNDSLVIIWKGQHDGAAITARRSWVHFMATWSMHVLPVSVLVPSWHSGFLSESIDMHVGLIGDCKLPTGVNVSVNGCMSALWTCQLGSAPVARNIAEGKQLQMMDG